MGYEKKRRERESQQLIGTKMERKEKIENSRRQEEHRRRFQRRESRRRETSHQS